MLSNTPIVLLSVESAISEPAVRGQASRAARQYEQRIMVLYKDGTMEILGVAEDWYISAQSSAFVSILPRLPAAPLAAVVRENNVAAVLNDGSVVLVSLNENRILWSGSSHIREITRSGVRPEMEAEMLFDERGIFILSKNGATGFSHDGRRLWFMFLHNAAAIPALGEDGVLYSGGRDWILYTYKVENRALPARNSIYGPIPEGSYRTGSPQSSFTSEVPLFDHEIRARLEQIETAINSGRVGANEIVWKTFLLTLSASQEDIQFKITALNLLGQIGSRETIPWLVNIFRRETEPLVRAAAVSAIGAIGVDPDGIAIQTFLHTLIQTQIRDVHVLTAIASATGALCRFSGPPLSETGIRILNLLSESTQPSAVRRQANGELASLR
jgi:outer membrane protein assembly factor BamB